MEEKESSGSGVAVTVSEAPESYRVAPRTENPTQLAGAPVIAAASPVSVAAPSTEVKKKRGRPRKYGPDGARAGPASGAVSLALSPMPISSSIPLTGDFSAWKRGRGRPIDSVKKSHKSEYESPGELMDHFLDICTLFVFFDFEILKFLVTVGFVFTVTFKTMICWYGYLGKEESESCTI